MRYEHLFGPVMSRRLGLSLGIDLLPYKTCSVNCVYCECGETTNLTLERQEFIPTEEVISELDNYLQKNPKLDYITFAGSGEPTLAKNINAIIKHVKKNYPKYKLALLTNGTLFTDEQLIEEVLGCDFIIPSLDAVSNQAFQEINRPHKDLDIKKIIEGLVKLRQRFKGEIWLEIFIVPGINDNQKELNEIKQTIEKIKPQKIQINTLERPGAEDWVEKPSKEKLQEILNTFSNCEIVNYQDLQTKVTKIQENVEDNIINLVKRRPSKIDDIAKTLDMTIPKVRKYILLMTKKGKIKIEEDFIKISN